MVKSGFTLIELIFAIVVISISVISLPTMTQTTSKGIDANLVQEAIFAASAELNGAISAQWDENSMKDDKYSLSRVIDIDDKCDNSHLLAGHIAQPLHRRCLTDSDISPLDGTADDEIYALEDMAHDLEDVFSTSSSANGYKKQYKSKIEISRGVDFNGSIDNHIKEIKLTITDSDENTITLLKTYSANVGEVDFFKKVY